MLGEGGVVILPWVGGVVGGIALILISCYSLVVTPSWSIKRGEKLLDSFVGSMEGVSGGIQCK